MTGRAGQWWRVRFRGSALPYLAFVMRQGPESVTLFAPVRSPTPTIMHPELVQFESEIDDPHLAPPDGWEDEDQ